MFINPLFLRNKQSYRVNHLFFTELWIILSDRMVNKTNVTLTKNKTKKLLIQEIIISTRQAYNLWKKNLRVETLTTKLPIYRLIYLSFSPSTLITV